MKRFLTSALFLLAACSGDSTADDAGTDAANDHGFVFDVAVDQGVPWDGALPVSCTPDASAPSFTTDVTPLFTGCGGGEFCHAPVGDAGAFPYDQLVNFGVSREMCAGAGVRVFPSSLPKSYLINKLTGLGMCPSTTQMPMTGDPFSSDQLQTVADWICQGAPNN